MNKMFMESPYVVNQVDENGRWIPKNGGGFQVDYRTARVRVLSAQCKLDNDKPILAHLMFMPDLKLFRIELEYTKTCTTCGAANKYFAHKCSCGQEFKVEVEEKVVEGKTQRTFVSVGYKKEFAGDLRAEQNRIDDLQDEFSRIITSKDPKLTIKWGEMNFMPNISEEDKARHTEIFKKTADILNAAKANGTIVKFWKRDDELSAETLAAREAEKAKIVIPD